MVVAGDVVGLADGGEQFGLFDGVDAEVGFEVEFEVEHLGWVAGLCGDELEDLRCHRIDRGRGGCDWCDWCCCHWCGCWCGGRGCGAEAGVDEADDVVEGGVVAEFELVVAGDVVRVADGGEQFGLLHRVDAEVGFEVEIEVEHLGRVAGLCGDELEDLRRHRIDHRCGSDRRCWHWRYGCWRGGWCGGRWGGAEAGVDEADDVVEGGVVAEFELVVAGDVVRVADGGEQFGLLHRVDAEVGFEVEIEVEHLGRVAGLCGDELEDLRRHRIDHRCGSDRRCWHGHWGCDRRCWRDWCGNDRCGNDRCGGGRRRGRRRNGCWRCGGNGDGGNGSRVCRRHAGVDHTEAPVDDLELGGRLPGHPGEPGAPRGRIDQTARVTELVNAATCAVGHRGPPQQHHADLRSEPGSEAQCELHRVGAAS